MNNVENLHRDNALSTIRIHEDRQAGVHWCHMHAQQAFSDPEYRTCFSPKLLRELRLFAQLTVDGINRSVAESSDHMAHIVIASDAHVFNLGGDLTLFTDLIRRHDEEELLRYAHKCVDSIHLLYTRLHPNAHTIALVEGDALGGGLELALACQTIVAEKGVQMGFPEVLFGLFPGMGAYSLLSRRISPKLAEQMMLNGVMYSSEELHDMGVVDILVPKGEGVRAVHEFVRRNRGIANARLAVHKAREIASPITLDELNKITEVWVDAALKLNERQLKVMERLARAQLRRPKTMLEQVTAV